MLTTLINHKSNFRSKGALNLPQMLYPGSTHDVVLRKFPYMLAKIRVATRLDKSAHARHFGPFSLGHMGQLDQVKYSCVNVYRYFLLMLLIFGTGFQ